MPILDKNNKEQVEKYSKFVRKYDGSSFMQDINWNKVKSNWVQECVYVEENNEIIATMTILCEKVPHLNTYIMYSPRGPVCNTSDINIVNRLVDEAKTIAKKYKAFVLKFDPQILYSDELNKMYIDNGYKTSGKNPDNDIIIQPAHEAVLDIDSKDEENLLKSFMEKTRYNIRLSKRKGINVRYSHDEDDLKIFYELYKITTIRDKINARSYEYFQRMLEAFDKNHLRIYIAEHENDSLSAAIAINYGRELFYLYGASSNEKRNLMPNYSMQWEMIKWGLETKCKTYNFGGVVHLEKDNGLYKFKTGFCKEEGIKQYIGEINKVYNPLMYFLYTNALSFIRKKGRKKLTSNKN